MSLVYVVIREDRKGQVTGETECDSYEEALKVESKLSAEEKRKKRRRRDTFRIALKEKGEGDHG